MPDRPDTTQQDSAHIIVFGNEKGGSGKSTTAMHVSVALLRLGYNVGSLDLDARQGTLTRYMGHRWHYSTQADSGIPMPNHLAVDQSRSDSIEARKNEERGFLDMALAELGPTHDFIVIDTPGTDSHLGRLAHRRADTLITPLNDSLLDLDLLARIDPDTQEIKGPSVYTQMVQEQTKERHAKGEDPLRWIVMRNRLSHIDARNKRTVADLLDKIADLYGFDIAPGFSERVIFRELFLKGLTMLDLKEEDAPLTLSHLSARQEVRQLIHAIGPEHIRGYKKPPRFDKSAAQEEQAS